ncbi:MAG: hypothetical protein RML56_08815 [Burkholderiales bacterium]|nr:hypothetical protein [Burkholderiales bacterium]
MSGGSPCALAFDRASTGTYDTRDPTQPVDVKQNITVSLPRELVRRARALAARRRTSVSALVAAELERRLGEERAWRQSRRKALALLRQGLHLGGRGIESRDALHDRLGLR